MCAVCKKHWYFDSGKEICKKCGHVKIAPFVWGAVTVAILTLGIAPVINPSLVRSCISLEAHARLRDLATWFRQLLWDDTVVSQAKVVWTAYQILGSTSYSIDYVSFSKTFDKMELAGLPMNCLFDNYNDHIRLLVLTYGPMVLAVLLGVVFRIRAWASGLYERYILTHVHILFQIPQPVRIHHSRCPCAQVLAPVRVLCHSAGVPLASVHLEHYVCHVRLHRLQ